MKAVTFDKVNSGFRKNRFEINKKAIIPTAYDRFSDTDRFDAFRLEQKDGDLDRGENDMPKRIRKVKKY